MSEHMWGVGRGKVSKALRSKIDKAIEGTDASFTAVTLPGDGPRYWFAGPNRGMPFDGRMEREVADALTAAGIRIPLTGAAS